MKAEVIISKDGRDKVRNAKAIYTHSIRETINLDDVEFWWPRGYGDPALYDVTLRILDRDGKEVDSCHKRMASGLSGLKALPQTQKTTLANSASSSMVRGYMFTAATGLLWMPFTAATRSI